MSALDQLRKLFVGPDRVRPRNASRYHEYGLFDAHTGVRVGKKFPTRSQAEAAKSAAKDPHRMRVRGVPPKPKKAAKPKSKREAA